MSNIDNSEIIEGALRLNEGAQLVCKAVDLFLMLPDETPFTAGDLKTSFEGLKNVIAAQQITINQHTEHALEINDMLNRLSQKYTKE